MEILSPAGNFSMLEAAVRTGADAVYLGLKDFSARRNAENFSKEELESAIEYCHIRGVRVYLALNTLIKDAELELAFSSAQFAYNKGIDGIIVQDLGLAKILSEKIPELELHASTQMSVHSPSALIPLKKLGFKQVVASREMSKNDLALLCQKAKELGIRVEVFVHGALCMSVSGQCLLSAFLGSRSGNRGLCAGPCRLPFKAENGTGYDLSLKDLSLIDYLDELKNMGVYSFKIEGRMKRQEYVAAATAACKNALEGKRDEELLETLRDVFSRSGFTDGYYKDRLGRDMFGIRTKDDVLSSSKAFPYLHSIYRAERQSVAVKTHAEILKDKPIKLTLKDMDGNSVTATGVIPEIAKTKGINYDDTLKNLTKFGSTPYYAIGGGLRLDEGLFVSSKDLNELRRNAVEELNKLRAKNNRNSTAEYTFKKDYVNQEKQPKIYARFENTEQIPDNLEGIFGIILPLEKAEKIDFSGELIADIPRGIKSEEKIFEMLKNAKEKGFKKALCPNIALLPIIEEAGLEIMADTSLNITNSESISLLSSFGAKSAVISPELSIAESKNLFGLKKGIIAYGNIPLMLFKNCPIKNGKECAECDKKGVLRDRMGIEFPVRCRMGFSELLNSVPIYLADKKDSLSNFDFYILYFTRESKTEAQKIIENYKFATPCDFKYTRGLYFRSVM